MLITNTVDQLKDGMLIPSSQFLQPSFAHIGMILHVYCLEDDNIISTYLLGK